MKYFQNKLYGWMDFCIEGHRLPISYIQNVPLLIINTYSCFQLHQSAVMTFDAEGWEWDIVFRDFDAYIVIHKDSTEIIILNTSSQKLIEEMFQELSSDLIEFAKWQNEDDIKWELKMREYQQKINYIKEWLKDCREVWRRNDDNNCKIL